MYQYAVVIALSSVLIACGEPPAETHVHIEQDSKDSVPRDSQLKSGTREVIVGDEPAYRRP